eukprot:5036046-Prymnesium_polylepis.1
MPFEPRAAIVSTLKVMLAFATSRDSGRAGRAALSIISTDDTLEGAQTSLSPAAAMPDHFPSPKTPHSTLRTASVA